MTLLPLLLYLITVLDNLPPFGDKLNEKPSASRGRL